jgi:hypothetical protein
MENLVDLAFLDTTNSRRAGKKRRLIIVEGFFLVRPETEIH